MKLIIKNSHFKILYSNSQEKQKIKPFLIEKFTFKDEVLLRTYEVKKGLKSPFVSFYIEEYDLLPTGFLPFAKVYLKKENFEYELEDLRRFPYVNEEFLNSSMSIKGRDGILYTPRDYQLEAVKEVIKKKGGGIQIATGMGKGFVHALLCKAYSKSRILNVFDRIDLIDQTYKAFTEKYGFDRKEIGIIQGSRVEDDRRITLLSLQSYESAMGLFPNISVIIADEAHGTMRNETAEKIIFSCQNAPIKIGISATLNKIANPYQQSKLYSIMGPIVYRKEIIEGIEEKALSPGDVVFHKYNSEAKEIKGTYQDSYETKKISKGYLKSLKFKTNKIYKQSEVIKEIEDKDEINKIKQIIQLKDNEKLLDYLNEIINKDFEQSLINEGWEIFNKKGERYKRRFLEFGDESNSYIENEVRNRLIKKIALEESLSGKRTLIMFSRISHGKKLKELLPEALLISGINSLKERDEVEHFAKTNKNAIVISSTIWSTGKDIPELESFINCSGGKSAISVIQRLGRLTRNSVKSGKKKFRFHDFMDDHINSIARKQTQERIKILTDLKLPIFYKEHN